MPFLIILYLLFGISVPSLTWAFVAFPARSPTHQHEHNGLIIRSCSLTVTPAQRSLLQPLHMSNGQEAGDGGKQFAASVLASAYILSCILTSSTAALAVTTDHVRMPTCISDATTTSTLTLSARSGGRMGGLHLSASNSRPEFRPPSRLPGSATSRQYGQALIVRPTPVLSPAFGLVDISPFGSGFGSNGALGTASAINEGIRETREEGDIRNERVGLLEQQQQRRKSKKVKL